MKQLRVVEAVTLFGMACLLLAMVTGLLRDLQAVTVLASDLFHSDGMLRPVAVKTCLVATLAALIVACLAYVVAYFMRVYCARWAAYWILALLLVMQIVTYYLLLLGWRSLWGDKGLLTSVPILGSMAGIFGYGWAAVVSVTVLRYLPLGVMFIYFRLRQMPLSLLLAAWNHGMSARKVHMKLVFPWVRGVMFILIVFTFTLVALDGLANSVVGGSQVMLLGNVIRDWDQSQYNSGAAMALSLVFTLSILVATIVTFWLLSRSPSLRQGTSAGATPLHWLRLGTVGFIVLMIFVVASEWSLLVAVGIRSLGWQPRADSAELAGGFPTLDGYSVLFGRGELREGMCLSLWIGALTATCATVGAVVSALAKHLRESTVSSEPRHPYGWCDVLILWPLLIPPLILGRAAGHLIGVGSPLMVVLVHLVVFGPLAFYVLVAVLGHLSPRSLYVARNHGVGKWRYRWFVFRLMCPGLPVAWLLVFALSLNDSILVRYVAGFSKPLSLVIADRQLSSLGSGHFAAIVLMAALSLLALWLLRVLAKLGGEIEDG